MKQKLLLDLFQIIGLLDIDPQNFTMTGNPMNVSDKVLGEMNNLEKSCMMFINTKDDECKKIEEQSVGMDKDSEEYLMLSSQYDHLKGNKEVATAIMWASVRSRFEPEKGYSGYAFCDDNKVVAVLKKDQGEIIIPGMMGLIVMGMSRRYF